MAEKIISIIKTLLFIYFVFVLPYMLIGGEAGAFTTILILVIYLYIESLHKKIDEQDSKIKDLSKNNMGNF